MSSNSFENVPTGSIIPYPKNSRTHSPAQIQQICDSIQEFGFTTPILVDENNVALAGHGRLEAAKKLGMETVPAVRVVGLSDSQKRAYVIADNKIGLNSGWDQTILAEELQALSMDSMNLEVTGFDFRELDGMGMFSNPEHDMQPIQLGGDTAKSKGKSINSVVSFGQYKLGVSAKELAALEACLKHYEDLYGLHQGFIGWLTEGKA